MTRTAQERKCKNASFTLRELQHPTALPAFPTPSLSPKERISEDGNRASVDASAVEDAVQELAASRDQSLDNVEPEWERKVEGRWALRYSTEGPLLGIIQNGMFPFGPTGQVYQLFNEGGCVENVIEFVGYGDENTAWPAVLSVTATYVARKFEQGFDFKFEKTKICYGRAAVQRITGAKTGRKGPSLDFALNVAFGKGFVQVLWLDHAIRIDESMLQGKKVMNVYAYDGPVEKCKVQLPALSRK